MNWYLLTMILLTGPGRSWNRSVLETKRSRRFSMQKILDSLILLFMEFVKQQVIVLFLCAVIFRIR